MINRPKTKKFFFYLEQVIIFVAHILLLGWILYLLYNAGLMPTEEIVLHFFGIAVYGALLIRICAYLAKRRYLKE